MPKSQRDGLLLEPVSWQNYFMREYNRAIFFTKVSLGGYYKYKDIFQIFPADLENMPKSAFQKHYPNIIEFWISDEDEVPFPTELENLKDLYTHRPHDGFYFRQALC